jgi:uncharacterized membrane protein YfcA
VNDFLTAGMVLGVGLLSGALNVMAGGGSLLTLPMLLFLGFPPALANGTNRVAILAQNVVAVSSFRSRGFGDMRTGLILGAAALPGGLLGAFAALVVSDEWFRRILGGIIVAGLITLLFPKKKTAARGEAPKLKPHIIVAFFGIGFYGGFIQAGVGMVFLLVLHNMLHLDLVRVNAYKVLIVLVYTVPALAVFVWSDNVNWTIGALLAVGSSVGAWIGARLAMAGGEKLVRYALAGALGIMAVRLFVA